MGVHLTSHTSITSALHEVESLCAQSMALRPSYHSMVVIKHNKREMDLIALLGGSSVSATSFAVTPDVRSGSFAILYWKRMIFL